MKLSTKLALSFTAVAVGSCVASHFVTKAMTSKDKSIIHDETDIVDTDKPLKENTLLLVRAAQTKRTSRIRRANKSGKVVEEIIAETTPTLMPVVKSALRRISRDYHELLEQGKDHKEIITLLNSRNYAGLTNLKIS